MDIVCDSSSLISLSENCLLWILDRFEKARFLIPIGVKKEIIDRPFETKKFLLSAIRLNHLLRKGTLQLFTHPNVGRKADQILDLANHLFKYQNNYVRIIHRGEAEMLAAAHIIGARGVLIDERTTRHLIEDIQQLKKYIESRTGTKINLNKKAERELRTMLSDLNVMRSAELFAYAYEKGYLNEYGTQRILEAGLWSLKFSGCSMSSEEVKEYIEMLR